MVLLCVIRNLYNILAPVVAAAEPESFNPANSLLIPPKLPLDLRGTLDDRTLQSDSADRAARSIGHDTHGHTDYLLLGVAAVVEAQVQIRAHDFPHLEEMPRLKPCLESPCFALRTRRNGRSRPRKSVTLAAFCATQSGSRRGL